MFKCEVWICAGVLITIIRIIIITIIITIIINISEMIGGLFYLKSVTISSLISVT